MRSDGERYATREEAAARLAAVPTKTVGATGFYAGLRRGELMALRKSVDLKGGTILVARGWDDHGATTTKNRKHRRVPIVPQLRV